MKVNRHSALRMRVVRIIANREFVQAVIILVSLIAHHTIVK